MLKAAGGRPQGAVGLRRRASLAASARCWVVRRAERVSQSGQRRWPPGSVVSRWSSRAMRAMPWAARRRPRSVRWRRERARWPRVRTRTAWMVVSGRGAHGFGEASEAFSLAFGPGAGVGALEGDGPASPGGVGGEAGEEGVEGVPALVGGGGAGVEGDVHRRVSCGRGGGRGRRMPQRWGLAAEGCEDELVGGPEAAVGEPGEEAGCRGRRGRGRAGMRRRAGR